MCGRGCVIHDPDFAQGIQYGRECYFELDSGKTFSDAEVTAFIVDCLSRKKYKRAVELSKVNGFPPPSYAYGVGFVVGWLNALFSAATTPHTTGHVTTGNAVSS
jgi:hypothetical protein